MAGWTSSDINAAGLLGILNGNAASSGGPGPFYNASSTNSFSGDTIGVTLWSNTPTTATALTDTFAHNVYLAAGGQWVTGSEITGTGYTAGGMTLATKTETISGAVITFNAASLVWTITGTITTYGALLNDNTTTAKNVYCWNYFGGVQTVTAGTFTVNWNASGIFAVTCS